MVAVLDGTTPISIPYTPNTSAFILFVYHRFFCFIFFSLLLLLFFPLALKLNSSTHALHFQFELDPRRSRIKTKRESSKRDCVHGVQYVRLLVCGNGLDISGCFAARNIRLYEKTVGVL